MRKRHAEALSRAPESVDISDPDGTDPLAVAVSDGVAIGKRVRRCPTCSGWLIKHPDKLRCEECGATWEPIRVRRVDWPRVFGGLTGAAFLLGWTWVVFAVPLPRVLKAIEAILAVLFGGGQLIYALLPRDNRGRNALDRRRTDSNNQY